MKNLKHFFVLLLSGITLIVLFQFCENSVDYESAECDFINPYEFIGEIHNDGLNYIFQKTDFTKSSAINLEKVSELTTLFIMSNKNCDILKYDNEKCNELEELIKTQILGDGKNILSYPLLQKDTNGDQYLTKLKKTFRDINFEDTASSFRLINKLESEIWNSAISENEKQILLTVSAVGKHSFSFWKRNHYNYVNIDLSNSKGANWREFAIKLLESDMEGALVGAIIGIIKGSIEGSVIMPGTGSLTGAILEGVQGAVYGAIVSSAIRFFFMII